MFGSAQIRYFAYGVVLVDCFLVGCVILFDLMGIIAFARQITGLLVLLGSNPYLLVFVLILRWLLEPGYLYMELMDILRTSSLPYEDASTRLVMASKVYHADFPGIFVRQADIGKEILVRSATGSFMLTSIPLLMLASYFFIFRRSSGSPQHPVEKTE